MVWVVVAGGTGFIGSVRRISDAEAFGVDTLGSHSLLEAAQAAGVAR